MIEDASYNHQDDACGAAVLLVAFVFAIALEKWGLNRAPFMLNKKAD